MNADRVVYLSPPSTVSMGDDWFGVADLDHFWIRRRFAVMTEFAGNLFNETVKVGEIGCGWGIVQRQCEDRFGIKVHGFDLNEHALLRNVSRRSPVYCYDIHDRRENLTGAFDVLIMFDVLEHIDDHDTFIRAAASHVKPGGHLVINVPAIPGLMSAYDRAVGHVRRYDRSTMQALLERNGVELRRFTYWGLPLLPLLLLRTALQRGEPDPETIRRGFHSRGTLMNRALQMLAGLEYVPQSLGGTSLMAIATRVA